MQPIINERDYWTLKAMTQFGGGFVKILAELAHRADSDNYPKIKNTWSLYWTQYEEVGVRLEKAHNDKKNES